MDQPKHRPFRLTKSADGSGELSIYQICYGVALAFIVQFASIDIGILGCLGLYFLSWISATVWHELGHLVFGLTNKLKLLSFMVLKTELYRAPTGWRVRRVRDRSLLGMVRMVGEPSGDFVSATYRFILGGPAFTGLGLVTSGLLAALCAAEASRWVWWWLLLGLQSAWTAYVTLVQPKGVHHSCDGRQLQIMKGDAARYAIALGVLRAYRNCDYPWDLPGGWIDLALESPPSTLYRYNANIYSYNAAYIQGDYDKAEQSLDEMIAMLELVPETNRGNILREAAVFAACIRQDLEKAQAFLTGADGLPEFQPGECARASAAVKSLTGDYEGAAIDAREALSQREGDPFSPYDAEWLQRLASGGKGRS